MTIQWEILVFTTIVLVAIWTVNKKTEKELQYSDWFYQEVDKIQEKIDKSENISELNHLETELIKFYICHARSSYHQKYIRYPLAVSADKIEYLIKNIKND